MGKNIDELLSDEPTEELNPKVEEAKEPEAQAEETTEAQPRGPDGKFASKEEKGVEQQEAPAVEPPSTENDKLPQDVYEPLKAVRNENKELKAQLEEQARQMQAFFAQQQAQQKAKPEEPAPEFWDDPQAFIARQFQQFGPQLMQQMQEQQFAQAAERSEAAAKQKYADYDEKFGAFQQAVQLNPALLNELRQAPDPAEFAYSKGKVALELQRHGSIDEVIKAERVKWEAEARAALNPHTPNLPTSTATDGSVGGRTGPAWSGPKPMTELLG